MRTAIGFIGTKSIGRHAAVWGVLALAGLSTWLGCSDKGDVNPFNPSDVPVNFIGSVTASPSRLNAGNQQSTISVLVIDENGDPVQDIAVRFEAELGAIDSAAVSDASGFARASFTSGSTEGTARVRVYLGSFLKEVLIQIGQGDLVAGASSIIADGSSTTTLTVQVLDDVGQPRIGIPVFFQSSAGFVSPTVFTENDGKAEATLRSIASETDVEATITATTPDPENPTELLVLGDAIVTFRGIRIDMTVDRTTLVADGVDSTFVHVFVKETTSQITVPKVFVSYGTSLGTISSSDSTDATGQSDATLFAGTSAGTAVVVGTIFGALSDTLTVSFTPLTLRILSANPTTLPADGASESSITAILLNASNNPVSDKAITFSTNRGVVTGTAVTGEDGRAVGTLTASDVPDTAVVVAAFGTLRDSVSVPMTSLGLQIPASILIRTASPKIQVAQTGGLETTTLTAEVFNEEGDVIQTGFDVSFRITSGPGGGEYLGAPANGVGPVTVPIEDGTARIAISSGTISGTLEVEATVPPLLSANTRIVVGAGPPDSIGIAVSTLAFPLSGALFSYIVTATVVDRYSNSVEDSTAVFFDVSGDSCGAGQPLPDVAIDGLAFTHNLADCPGVQNIAHGVAVTCLKAPFTTLDQFPNFFISAETAGGDVRTCKNFTSGTPPGDAASIALVSVESSAIGVRGTGQEEASELVFEVRDATGQAVNQDHAVQVEFEFQAQTGGGEYLSPTSVVTDANGLARTTLNSGTLSGIAKVRAKVTGSSPLISSSVVSVAIHGGPPDPAHFSIAANQANIAGRVYFGLEDDITAFVYDVYGNPVPQGTVVYFSTNRGGVTGSSVTDAIGQARATLFSAAPTPTCADTGYAYVQARTIDGSNATIATDARVLFSGPTVLDVAFPATSTFAVPNGGSQTIIFYVGDDCGNPLVASSTITTSLTGSGSLVGDVFISMPDTQSPSATFVTVTVFDTDGTDTLAPANAFVTITVTSPNGSGSLIYGGTVD
jgi:adhesin/invasin